MVAVNSPRYHVPTMVAVNSPCANYGGCANIVVLRGLSMVSCANYGGCKQSMVSCANYGVNSCKQSMVSCANYGGCKQSTVWWTVPTMVAVNSPRYHVPTMVAVNSPRYHVPTMVAVNSPRYM